jgi:polyhydroxybutyrate depolymerase
MRIDGFNTKEKLTKFCSCFIIILLVVLLILIFLAWRLQNRNWLRTNQNHNVSTSVINTPVNNTQDISPAVNSQTSNYTLGSGDYNYSLNRDGLERTYLVHVPKKYNSDRSLPLILILHGAGGSGAGMVTVTNFNSKAEQAGFIVAYPDGIELTKYGSLRGVWNAGNCLEEKNTADDVGFIRQIIDELATKFNIDSKRIYAAGFSNGAMMSHRLACELTDKLAAVAAVSGGLSLDYKLCKPTQPIPLLHIHGLKDPVVKFTGGGIQISVAGCNRQSISEVMNFWREKNNCSQQTKNIYQDGGTSCSRYLNCQNNNEVALYTIDSGGHTWPQTKEFSATNYIWDEFFSKISK